MYPVAGPGFRGGTETYVNVVAAGLAAAGHDVHVVAPDATTDEQRAHRLWYWPSSYHPWEADAVVAVHSLAHVRPDSGYRAPILICATNGLGADFGPDDGWAPSVDAWPVFSRCHAELLVKRHPAIDAARCHVTGLGIDLAAYPPGPAKVAGRVLVANDPARGLWHVLDIFDALRLLVPEATLHVAYDVDGAFQARRWQSTALAEVLLDCQKRLAATPGITVLGAIDRDALVAEQLACQVHVWPSDPPNVGSQIHGLTQMECAAAGAALVLSDIEAFPDVFAAAATILPVPGTFVPELEGRVTAQHWADVIAGLMRTPSRLKKAQRASRALAARHDWSRVVASWCSMLTTLARAADTGNVSAPTVVTT